MRPCALVRPFAWFLVPSLLACTASVPERGGATERRPPNVVFVLADDLGWRDLGCYGSDFYETPRLDRLAREGLRFTQAYAACPVCSPTRASILTGRWPVRTGITDWISPQGTNQPEHWTRATRLLPAPYADRLALDELTLAEAFRAAGYATFFAGKWHLGPRGSWPTEHGFDVNRGGWESGGPYGGERYFSPYGNPNLSDGPPGEHLPARLAEETMAFVRAHAERPFFAYLSFYSVHTPLLGRADLVAKYEDRGVTTEEDDWGREGERKVRLAQKHAVYAAMVEALDEAVGRVLDGLDELGLANDTIVVFTSDNGGLSTSEGHPTSNLPLRAGKGWLYEGGIREPLIVRYPPRIAPASTCDALVSSPDFYPTLLELAGLPLRPEQHLDGTSLVPQLTGDPASRPRPLYWHYPHYGNQGGQPSAAIRLGDWKLLELYDTRTLELYNLADDPGEHTNRAPEHPALVHELGERLHTWQSETRARFARERSTDDN